MTFYTQPKQEKKSWTHDHPEGSLGPYTPGIDCVHCGLPGFEHEKERVYPESGPTGSYHYQYRCPK